MDESQHLGIGMAFEGVLDPVGIDRLAPFGFHHNGGSAGTLDVFDHPATEHTIPADDHFIARGDGIDEAGLHADRTRAGHREGERVIGLVRVTQQGFQFLHHLDENRIEIADCGQRHGGQYPWIDLRRARAHQGALRRMERGDFFAGRNLLERGMQAHGEILSGAALGGAITKHISSRAAPG